MQLRSFLCGDIVVDDEYLVEQFAAIKQAMPNLTHKDWVFHTVAETARELKLHSYKPRLWGRTAKLTGLPR